MLAATLHATSCMRRTHRFAARPSGPSAAVGTGLLAPMPAPRRYAGSGMQLQVLTMRLTLLNADRLASGMYRWRRRLTGDLTGGRETGEWKTTAPAYGSTPAKWWALIDSLANGTSMGAAVLAGGAAVCRACRAARHDVAHLTEQSSGAATQASWTCLNFLCSQHGHFFGCD